MLYQLPNKITLSITAILFAVTSFTSCQKDEAAATSQFIGEWHGTGCNEKPEQWVEKTAMPSYGRNEACIFNVDNDIFVCGGDKKKDLWKYSSVLNQWEQKKDVQVSGNWRRGAVAFSMGNLGYVIGGIDIDNVYWDSVFEFDASSDRWAYKTKFPGHLRRGAFCFVIGDTAIIGGGISPSGEIISDVYAFVPSRNQWYLRNTMPYRAAYVMAFSNGHDGYITTGKLEAGQSAATYKYDNTNDKWTEVAPFPGGARQGGAAFTIDNIAYCGLGDADGALQQDYYSYNMASNSWSKVASYPGGPTAYGVASSAGGKGYAGTGTDYINSYSKWYEYTPKSTESSIFNIVAGNNNYSVIVKCDIGTDSCMRTVSVNGTVSGNTDKNSFSMATQSFVDKCGRNYTVSGSGTLSGDNQILITTLIADEKSTKACTFRGSK